MDKSKKNYNTSGPLQVGIDVRMVYYRQAGIGQYIINLLQQMAGIDHPDLNITLFQSFREKGAPEKWLGNPYPYRKLFTPAHHRFEQLALPVELLLPGPAVFHSPDFIPPLRRWRKAGMGLKKIAGVITVHDLAFLRFPHLLTSESAGYYGQIGRACQSAQLIISVSYSTANDLVTELGVSRDKIRVIHEAANPIFKPLTPDDQRELSNGEAKKVADKLAAAGIKKDSFILFVSTIEPRKNIPTLLKAYRNFLDGLAPGEEVPKLVMAGREGWLFEDVYKLAGELRLEQQLVWLGGVSTEELLWLYNSASFLVMPSLYEGFGLPPLEALACGLPALAADSSSLPEVVGKVGWLIPPQDVQAWSEAIREAWSRRKALKLEITRTGPAWAATFSWEKVARQTLEVYRESSRLV